MITGSLEYHEDKYLGGGRLKLRRLVKLSALLDVYDESKRRTLGKRRDWRTVRDRRVNFRGQGNPEEQFTSEFPTRACNSKWITKQTHGGLDA